MRRDKKCPEGDIYSYGIQVGAETHSFFVHSMPCERKKIIPKTSMLDRERRRELETSWHRIVHRILRNNRFYPFSISGISNTWYGMLPETKVKEKLGEGGERKKIMR